jgi:hypothetical protein
MTVSKSFSGQTPEFLAVSTKTNEPIDLPNTIVWNGIQLGSDELIVHITEKGEQQFITTHPFDENKYYKVILFDYSS